jgi:hypothetical protein
MSFLRCAVLSLALTLLVIPGYSQTTVDVGYNGSAIALAFHDQASGSTSSSGALAITRIHEGDTVQFNWRGNFHNITPYDTTDRNAGANVPVSSSAIMSSPSWNSSTRSSTYQCTRHPMPMNGQVMVFEVARSFRVTAPSSVVAGAQFNITVTAIGQKGTTDGLYRGSIQFSTSDPNPSVVLPAAYTFVNGDNGTHVFNGVVLRTPAPSATITVSDAANGLTGQVTLRVDDPSRPRPPSDLRVQ